MWFCDQDLYDDVTYLKICDSLMSFVSKNGKQQYGGHTEYFGFHELLQFEMLGDYTCNKFLSETYTCLKWHDKVMLHKYCKWKLTLIMSSLPSLLYYL
jgi:hypothetical protein